MNTEIYIEFVSGPEELTARLTRLIENNESSLIAARADRYLLEFKLLA